MTEKPSVRDRFDQRHLIELHRRGLLEHLPLELGAMPIVDMGDQLWDELVSWGYVDGVTGQLSSDARDLFDGLIAYDWAIWGTMLLYNQRCPVTVDLPQEFFDYGVHHALREIPRVTFLIGIRKHSVVTAVMFNGHMDIYSDRPAGTRAPDMDLQVGTMVLSVLDPFGRWQPYPMPKVSILAPHSGGVAPAPRTVDPKTRTQAVTKTMSALQATGSSPGAAKVIGELLAQDNVATAQITISRRSATEVQTAYNNAAGLMFFGGTKTGFVVSYPVRAPDGRPWIDYASATPEALAAAIEALRSGLDAAGPADLVVR